MWVFCAVSATIAEVPNTPQRANAFRSAWIPAPPPESEVAIVIATGMRRSVPMTRRLETAKSAYLQPSLFSRFSVCLTFAWMSDRFLAVGAAARSRFWRLRFFRSLLHFGASRTLSDTLVWAVEPAWFVATARHL